MKKRRIHKVRGQKDSWQLAIREEKEKMRREKGQMVRGQKIKVLEKS